MRTRESAASSGALLRLQLNQAAQRCVSNDFCPTDELPDWLIYRQRCDFFISGDEAVINGNRASIERSRHFYRDDHFCIVLSEGNRPELEFVFLDCPREPVFNTFFPMSA